MDDSHHKFLVEFFSSLLTFGSKNVSFMNVLWRPSVPHFRVKVSKWHENLYNPTQKGNEQYKSPYLTYEYDKTFTIIKFGETTLYVIFT